MKSNIEREGKTMSALNGLEIAEKFYKKQYNKTFEEVWKDLYKESQRRIYEIEKNLELEKNEQKTI